MPPKFRSRIEPRFSDYDLQGVLNSRQYIDLVTEARTDQMRRCYKLPLDYYTEKGLTFGIRSIEMEFGAPIVYKAPFEIETWVEEIKGPIVIVKFRFVSGAEDTVHAEGAIKYFLMDLSSKRLIRVPEEEKKLFLGT